MQLDRGEQNEHALQRFGSVDLNVRCAARGAGSGGPRRWRRWVHCQRSDKPSRERTPVVHGLIRLRSIASRPSQCAEPWGPERRT